MTEPTNMSAPDETIAQKPSDDAERERNASGIESPPETYPRLIESLLALALLAVVAYSCWTLYGGQIRGMLDAMRRWWMSGG